MVARELDFNVKTEPNDEEKWYVNETVKVCSSCVEKQAIINQYKDELAAKTQENFDLELAMKRMEDAYKMEVEELKLKLEQPCTETSNDVFEVECLLNHKQVKSKQLFLVKWKGYDNRHNSWVEKKNLNCKKILEKFLEAKKLN